MPTQLSLARHLAGLRSARVAFVRYVDLAGPDAPVPTCAGWTVRDLVAHQERARRELAAVPASDAAYWTRRACHQATVRAVDAQAAVLGREPVPAETGIAVDIALDGIDERLDDSTWGPLSSDEEAVLVVSPCDAPDWWLVEIGPGAARTTRRSGPRVLGDWELGGGAVELYLMLWNRTRRTDVPATWTPEVARSPSPWSSDPSWSPGAPADPRRRPDSGPPPPSAPVPPSPRRLRRR